MGLIDSLILDIFMTCNLNQHTHKSAPTKVATSATLTRLKITSNNPALHCLRGLTLIAPLLIAPLFTGCANQPPAHPNKQTNQQKNQHKPLHQQPNHSPKPTKSGKTNYPTIKPTYKAPQYQYPSNYNSFYDWKNSFTQRAIQSGYIAADVQKLMYNASYNERVVTSDKNQSEFVKMPWEYVDSAVSDTRVSTGKRKFADNQLLFNRIQSIYGVDAGVVAAIWGMESSYGSFTGNADLASSLSTLAYEGRRRSFAEKQLKALLQLIQRGDVSWYQMEGSWAGGMGHTQFIPATWLTQGVDGNGDGHRNPWNTTDALSSTANYLSNSGWVRGLSPFYEVQLPNGFDFSKLGASLTYDQWANLGISPIYNANNYPPRGVQLKLWLPAGQDGPALLTSKNFDVIKVYNNSSSYALGVSLLGKRILGMSGLQKPWPRYERPLTKYQVENLQRNLTNAGYDTQGIDGVIGGNTRKAFARWQADHRQVADGFITQRSASMLMW